jgi:CO/xanthine dehydrogenase FAD-binding subunit
MVSLTAALDGVAVIWTPDGGERHVPVVDFVIGPGATVLRPGEVLRAVDVPTLPAGGGSATHFAFRKVALAPLGRSSSVVIGHGSRLTITAATTRPVVLDLAELDDGLAAIDCWYDDPHGPADWRAAITGVLAREVAEELAA